MVVSYTRLRLGKLDNDNTAIHSIVAFIAYAHARR